MQLSGLAIGECCPRDTPYCPIIAKAWYEKSQLAKAPPNWESSTLTPTHIPERPMHDPYQSPYTAAKPTMPHTPLELKHSGVGITSFIMGIFCIISFIGLCVYAAMMVANTVEDIQSGSPNVEPNEETFAMFAAVGFGTIVICLLAVVGVILGIIAVAQSSRKKIFGILGLTFNGLFLLGVVGLMILGSLGS